MLFRYHRTKIKPKRVPLPKLFPAAFEDEDCFDDVDEEEAVLDEDVEAEDEEDEEEASERADF